MVTFTIFFKTGRFATFATQLVSHFWHIFGIIIGRFKFSIKGRWIATQNTFNGLLAGRIVLWCIHTHQTTTIHGTHNPRTETLTVQLETF